MGFFNSYAREVKHDFCVKLCLIKSQFDSYSACKNKNLAHPSSLCKFGLPVTLLLTRSNLSIRCHLGDRGKWPLLESGDYGKG